MAGKRIVIVKGSPRKGGNSVVLAEQVAAGAEAAGAQVESFTLHQMEIHPCDACDACQGEPYRGCIIDDDMQLIYPKLREADALVIATPIYWFTVSAQTKLFMDRCYGLVDADGWSSLRKQIGIVLTFGDSDPYNSGAINAIRTFQDAFRYVGAEIAGLVYASANDPGEVRENETVMKQAYALGRRLAGG
jgi:multimeric flavodoxin WrbA